MIEGNVAYLLAQQVAYLGTITIGAGVFYGSKALALELYLAIPLTIIAGAVFLRFQMSFYRKELETD